MGRVLNIENATAHRRVELIEFQIQGLTARLGSTHVSSEIAMEAEILRLRDEIWRVEAATAERRRIRDSLARLWANLRDRLLVGVCAAWIQCGNII
jgi:hypothetical protein